MAFSYVFTLFMFFGSLFGAGNDLLDYVPAEAYWKFEATPLTFEKMADEVLLADPAAAVNLARVFEKSAGADRDRLALALIDQGESARAELDRLSRSADAELAARANACLQAIDKAPKAQGVRRLMAIRTLGALGKNQAIPLLQPLLKSKEPFVSEYAAEAIASLQAKPPPTRPTAPGRDLDIWRAPSDCRAVAHIAPTVTAPELADRVLGAMTMPRGMDRADAIDGLTFSLVEIADRFGNMRFDSITLAGSADLGENAGYVLAVLRGRYDHATVNRTLSDYQTAFNDFAGGRIYVPGGMAIYAPSDDLLIFAASPRGASPAQAVITAARSAPASRPATTPAAVDPKSIPLTRPCRTEPDGSQLGDSADMVSLIALVDTTQPVWVVARGSEAWHKFPILAGLQTLTLTGRPTHDTPLELKVDARLTDAAAARDAAAALTALLPPKAPAPSTQAGTADMQASSSPSPLLDALSAALAAKALNVDADRVNDTATFTLTRADIMRLLLASLDRSRLPKERN
jgi:hypothetical protein